MRTLEVLLSVSNEPKTDNGIIKTDVKFSWLDGSPIPLSFNNLCVIGLKTLFKKREIVDGPIEIIMRDIANIDEPVTKINNIRGRRFFMTTEDNKAYFWLCNGIKTDLFFNLEKEEQEILNWLLPPREGETKWFDLIAY
jgi:hypothetical protein